MPVELVTTSASGLDNNLTPAAALWQVPRVAQARQLSVEQVTQLVNQATQTPLLSFLGQRGFPLTNSNAVRSSSRPTTRLLKINSGIAR